MVKKGIWFFILCNVYAANLWNGIVYHTWKKLRYDKSWNKGIWNKLNSFWRTEQMYVVFSLLTKWTLNFHDNISCTLRFSHPMIIDNISDTWFKNNRTTVQVCHIYYRAHNSIIRVIISWNIVEGLIRCLFSWKRVNHWPLKLINSANVTTKCFIYS